ncbi:carboxymuconolactone decarboxylase family protein [filamentous cyanobacterium LEGE 11480]|uniref:Carboxymuconolactone decarboxylase family protein n=1 Tax=Romeriopsis navalis LEGE 11480 TaxID=2777977 RepID=A0A928VL19_9CYAN|nr:carboxymuconolactone decarboxylase family protein [Romeriopsis navalis]MBE9029693.1 carboxymuconolactone decarboxylase family protein [Romeriopsis navalis LEGE 11480]
MTNFTLHTEETAPVKSTTILQGAKKAYGFVPNLMAALAESPAALEAYVTLSGIFDKSDFTPAERQIVLMTNNRLNGCTYCMAAHSTISKMQKIPADVIETLRNGTSFTDPKLEALRVFSTQVNQNRGVLSDADIDAFIAAGYSQANVLEVILGTGLKVLSNYSNHVVNTPVDDAFQSDKWSADIPVAA